LRCFFGDCAIILTFAAKTKNAGLYQQVGV
jgi:hypothetical protein